jgi:surface antigen
VIGWASALPAWLALGKNSTTAPRLRGLRALVSLTVLAFSGAGAGGCSSTYQLGSLFGAEKTASASQKVEITGAAKLSPTATKLEQSPKVSDADLAAASAAAADVLGAGGKDASAPWQNPETGARGMITPLASAYSQDGYTCRDFLASVVREDAEAWLQGEACRVHHGKWVVRNVKPWKRA